MLKKSVKQKRAKKTINEEEMDMDAEISDEFEISSEKESSSTKTRQLSQFDPSDSEDSAEFSVSKEWVLHFTADIKYYNYQSLFPSPEKAKMPEECSVVAEPVSDNSFNSTSVFVCI